MMILLIVLIVSSFTIIITKDKKGIKINNKTDIENILKLNQEDSENFNNWFNSIIINIANNNMKLPENYADCAGLIRFAYKESLKKHDSKWLLEKGYKGIIYEDINKYNYPEIPNIGTNIFKSEDNWTNFVSARILIEKNMKYIGKDINKAESGNILYFIHPEDINFPYHVMIYIKNYGEDFLIYHTGPVDNDNLGEIRVVKLEEIKLSDPTWMPIKENGYFRGIFKFQILS
ncbi:DUF1175 family protein [Oceanotoga teriensis]|uniref:DUF1175 family protein n=1 Tax=Oceanotoga teriensis TaxID=515440 RepID=UPI00272ECBD2|nr:DUF1175 family protein [Oceanotoga teriensis]